MVTPKTSLNSPDFANLSQIKKIKPYSVIKSIHSETRSFTALNYIFKNSQEKSFTTEKFFAHESGNLIVLAALEKNNTDKNTNILFYSVINNETFFEPLDIKSTVQCIEFLDCFYPTSPDVQSMDVKIRNRMYSLLLGCKNGDLYFVTFYNNDPYRIEGDKIFNFVKTSNQGNAELCSIKKIKAFAPKNSKSK